MSIAETALPLFLPVRTLNYMSRSVPVYFRFAFGLRFSSNKKTAAARSAKVKREVSSYIPRLSNLMITETFKSYELLYLNFV